MQCDCGRPINKRAAEINEHVCECNRCWEIIDGLLIFSGVRSGIIIHDEYHPKNVEFFPPEEIND